MNEVIGHIYIIGLIGSSDTEKGVELQDVVSQVEANKDADVLNVHINSGGGSVNEGRLIANYLSKIEKPVTTIAETLCGSIATEIHLAVPIGQRKIIAGTEYFIHNPLIESVTGDAAALTEAAAYVKVYEKEMLSMYTNKTGLDKSALEGLMAKETSLTDEQAVQFGFVSEIIQKTELKAVAFYGAGKNDNKEKNILQKFEDMNKDLINKVKAIVSEGMKAITGEESPEVQGAMVSTDGGELSYASEGELPEVGEEVMVGEEPAAEGDYKTEDGTVIKVGAEGKVVEIVATEDEGEEDGEAEASVDALKEKIAELEAAAVAKEEEHKSEKDEMLETFKTEVDAKVEEVLKAVGSDFEPRGSKGKGLQKPQPKAKVSIAEAAAERKAKYKNK